MELVSERIAPFFIVILLEVDAELCHLNLDTVALNMIVQESQCECS